jgi:hypothetical protein
MGINSPLGNFVDIISNVKESARIYYAKLSASEASTRVTLIDPVLRVLGWDTANPDMIAFEKMLPKARVDYALYDQENKIRVIIEAKALGTDLGDKGFIFTLIAYAIKAGIKDIFLTDGVIWEHYSDFIPGNVIPNKILNFKNDNLYECALYLVKELDAAQFWQGKPIKAPDIFIIPNDFVELTKLPADLKGKKPPVSLRLPDGSTKEIRLWRDILLECCHFVLANASSLQFPIPDTEDRRLVRVNPLHEGDAQYKFVYNGQQVTIHVIGMDPNHCVANALHILKYLDQAKAKFNVAVRF